MSTCIDKTAAAGEIIRDKEIVGAEKAIQKLGKEELDQFIEESRQWFRMMRDRKWTIEEARANGLLLEIRKRAEILANRVGQRMAAEYQGARKKAYMAGARSVAQLAEEESKATLLEAERPADPPLAPAAGRRQVARGVCIYEGSVLVVGYPGEDRVMLPGGGLEAGEDPREACAREVLEETGYRVEVEDYLCDVNDPCDTRRFFLCRVIGGRATTVDKDPEGAQRVAIAWKPWRRASSEVKSHYDRAAINQAISVVGDED